MYFFIIVKYQNQTQKQTQRGKFIHTNYDIQYIKYNEIIMGIIQKF